MKVPTYWLQNTKYLCTCSSTNYHVTVVTGPKLHLAKVLWCHSMYVVCHVNVMSMSVCVCLYVMFYVLCNGRQTLFNVLWLYGTIPLFWQRPFPCGLVVPLVWSQLDAVCHCGWLPSALLVLEGCFQVTTTNKWCGPCRLQQRRWCWTISLPTVCVLPFVQVSRLTVLWHTKRCTAVQSDALQPKSCNFSYT